MSTRSVLRAPRHLKQAPEAIHSAPIDQAQEEEEVKSVKHVEYVDQVVQHPEYTFQT